MYNPYYEPPAGRAKVRYSRTEVLHLIVAVAVLTLVFAIVFPGAERTRIPTPMALLTSFIAVGSGFILHELAHKVVAQSYGHWAEFRAYGMGLALSLALAVATGIGFAAPGAVMIRGAVTRRENGIISIVGPATNFAIALATSFFAFQADTEDPVNRTMRTVSIVNAVLCVFNMIPLGPLDGRKVLAWSKPAYFGTILAAIALLVVVITGWPVTSLT